MFGPEYPKLTDGSSVYNVVLSEMTLHAVNRQAAEAIAETLKALIDCCTTDQAAIKLEYK